MLTEVGQAGVHSHPETEQDEAGVRSVGKSVYIELVIGDSRHKAMLDTGSDVTLIPAGLADMSQIRGSSRKLRAANGTLINLLGEWKTTVRLENLHLSMEFLVSDQIDEILIGIDWMRAHRCQLLLDSMTLSLHGRRLQLIEKVTVNRCLRLELQREVDQRAEILTCNNLTVKEVVVLTGGMEQQRLPNQCNQCQKAFTRPAGLRQHREAVHLDVAWPCQLCGDGQSSKSNLTRHYKRRHPNARNIPEPRRGSRETGKVSASKTGSAAAVSPEEAGQVPVHVRRVATGSSTGASRSRWQRAVHTVTSSTMEDTEEIIATEAESSNEETEVERKETSELEGESLDAAMRFRPLNKDGGCKNSEKPGCKWNALAERWAERVLRLSPEVSPRDLLPEFLEENPEKQRDGYIMLTSMEALRKILQRQQDVAISPVDDPPEAEGSPIAEENEVQMKTYLRAVQAQDISPVESESEASSESKMRLEDIEEVVDRAQTVNAEIQFISADDVIYAGDGFEDGMEDLEI